MRTVEGTREASVAGEVVVVVVVPVEEELGIVLDLGLGRGLAAIVVAHCVVLLFFLFFPFLVLSILLDYRAAGTGVVAAA